MKLTVHHTCSRDGDLEHIKKEAPYYSTHDEQDNQFKFLGAGYYFWDDNISVAHWWGSKRYQRKYLIFESEIEAKGNWFLDLVGNRRSMKWMLEMIQLLEESYGKTFTLSEAIELLKLKGEFNFRVIRAADIYFEAKDIQHFVPANDHFTNLNPVYIVCTIDKTPDLLVSFNLRNPK